MIFSNELLMGEGISGPAWVETILTASFFSKLKANLCFTQKITTITKTGTVIDSTKMCSANTKHLSSWDEIINSRLDEIDRPAFLVSGQTQDEEALI